MAFQVCQERAQWLDLAPDLNRKACMNVAIKSEHIFRGALAKAEGILREEEEENVGWKALQVSKARPHRPHRLKPYDRYQDGGGGARHAGAGASAHRTPAPRHRAAPPPPPPPRRHHTAHRRQRGE